MNFPVSKGLAAVLIVGVVLFAGGFITGNMLQGPMILVVTRTQVETRTITGFTVLPSYVTLTRYVETQTWPATPKTGDPGTSRLNPLPKGQKLTVGDWAFSVVGLERDAYAKIKAMNMFNSEPKPDKEAILVKVEAKVNLLPTQKATISLFWLKAVGERAIVYEHRWDVLEPKLDQEAFGGATVQGYVSFDVAKGEKGLILIVGDTWYLALE